jgi:hypothetical protein
VQQLDVRCETKTKVNSLLSSLLINNNCSFTVLCLIAAVFLLINLDNVVFSG